MIEINFVRTLYMVCNFFVDDYEKINSNFSDGSTDFVKKQSY